MLNRLRQLRRLWKLAKKDEQAMLDFMKLSSKEMMELPDADEKAVFISEGSQQEFREHQDEEKFGAKKIFSP